MCGRGFHPRFCFSWPNAKTAVMGGEQAAETMGDLATARSLLQEVAEGGDAAARSEAQRLLAGIA